MPEAGTTAAAWQRKAPRADARAESGPVVAGELEIRADQFQAFVGGQSLDLTRREFELLAEDDFAIIPEDANWVVSLALLTEVAHYLGDVPRAQWLYDHLLPYAEHNIITGGGWTCWPVTPRSWPGPSGPTVGS